MMLKGLVSLVVTAILLFGLPGPATAQKTPASGQLETVAKPMSEEEQSKREAKLRKELVTPYRNWLSDDVIYIITEEERKSFKNVQTDKEREQFIEAFWKRRDPSPDSQPNEFKDEHYRRIAYANLRFASRTPGWKTDRGMLYICFGPPDEVESHPSGETYQRSLAEGGGTTSTFPFEKWRYSNLLRTGTPKYFQIEFVDDTRTGDYRTVTDPSQTDALLMTPRTQLGLFPGNQRRNRTDGTPKYRFYDPTHHVNSRILTEMLSVHASPDLFQLWKIRTERRGANEVAPSSKP